MASPDALYNRCYWGSGYLEKKRTVLYNKEIHFQGVRLIKIERMPKSLNLPRKKRRVPKGLRVANGGCCFVPAESNMAGTQSNNVEMRQLIENAESTARSVASSKRKQKSTCIRRGNNARQFDSDESSTSDGDHEYVYLLLQ
jgi:hypothetical protein